MSGRWTREKPQQSETPQHLAANRAENTHERTTGKNGSDCGGMGVETVSWNKNRGVHKMELPPRHFLFISFRHTDGQTDGRTFWCHLCIVHACLMVHVKFRRHRSIGNDYFRRSKITRDGRTDGRTDTTSYRDAQSHLKNEKRKEKEKVIAKGWKGKRTRRSVIEEVGVEREER